MWCLASFELLLALGSCGGDEYIVGAWRLDGLGVPLRDRLYWAGQAILAILGVRIGCMGNGSRTPGLRVESDVLIPPLR